MSDDQNGGLKDRIKLDDDGHIVDVDMNWMNMLHVLTASTGAVSSMYIQTMDAFASRSGEHYEDMEEGLRDHHVARAAKGEAPKWENMDDIMRHTALMSALYAGAKANYLAGMVLSTVGMALYKRYEELCEGLKDGDDLETDEQRAMHAIMSMMTGARTAIEVATSVTTHAATVMPIPGCPCENCEKLMEMIKEQGFFEAPAVATAQVFNHGNYSTNIGDITKAKHHAIVQRMMAAMENMLLIDKDKLDAACELTDRVTHPLSVILGHINSMGESGDLKSVLEGVRDLTKNNPELDIETLQGCIDEDGNAVVLDADGNEVDELSDALVSILKSMGLDLDKLKQELKQEIDGEPILDFDAEAVARELGIHFTSTDPRDL